MGVSGSKLTRSIINSHHTTDSPCYPSFAHVSTGLRLSRILRTRNSKGMNRWMDRAKDECSKEASEGGPDFAWRNDDRSRLGRIKDCHGCEGLRATTFTRETLSVEGVVAMPIERLHFVCTLRCSYPLMDSRRIVPNSVRPVAINWKRSHSKRLRYMEVHSPHTRTNIRAESKSSWNSRPLTRMQVFNIIKNRWVWKRSILVLNSMK